MMMIKPTDTHFEKYEKLIWSRTHYAWRRYIKLYNLQGLTEDDIFQDLCMTYLRCCANYSVAYENIVHAKFSTYLTAALNTTILLLGRENGRQVKQQDGQLLSLDRVISDFERYKTSYDLSSFLSKNDVEKDLLDEEKRNDVIDLIAASENSEVLLLFVSEFTQTEIAEILQLSQSRVSKIIQEEIQKMKEKLL